MEEIAGLTDEIARSYLVTKVILWVLVGSTLGVAVWTIIDGMNPQRAIDRTRKKRGIDLMANVVDKPAFFRFQKTRQVSLGIGLVFIAIFLAVMVVDLMGNLDRTIDKMRNPPEEILELGYRGLAQQRREKGQEFLASLDVLQSRIDELQDAAETKDGDTTDEVAALQEALDDFLETSESSLAADRELIETVEKLKKMRGETE